uniref:mannitol 2-dehydrogenase n=1 Tax=Globodera rostochiensis TaxID=31243 RepID=A0A914HAD6_GLORO
MATIPTQIVQQILLGTLPQTLKLSVPNLNAIALSNPTIDVPKYSRAALSAGIVHFGVGNFHRAHQAVFLNELFNLGHDLDWAIIGAGVMPSDEQIRSCLSGQDYLTTVVAQDERNNTVQITGSMIDYLPVGNSAVIVAQLTLPAIRIVSLTITEGGYFLNSASCEFDPSHSGIMADAKNPDNPRTVFGLIVTALRRRRENGTQPFTVLSCDNITKNGDTARNACVGTARALAQPELADWIAKNVAFPNGMVDRITPVTGERERVACLQHYGIEDGWPVYCESFKQWVLEDNFCAGRPALEKVGVQFVPDVTPYEIMKLRLLNGGHAAIAYPAALLGLKFAHDAMQHKLINAFLHKLQTEEIVPTVPSVPGINLHDYCRLIQQRFGNQKIEDTIQRLCYDGTNRQPKFIIPTIEHRINRGQSIEGLALVCALWCRYCYGTDESGTAVVPNDPAWPQLCATAHRAKDSNKPSVWLSMEHIYGSVGQSTAFREVFAKTIGHLWQFGTESALKHYLGDTM